MFECRNCNISYHDADKTQNCLVCGSDLHKGSSLVNSNGISINIGFTATMCDECKSVYDCSVEKCDVCGEVFGLRVDKLVAARKEKFASIFEFIDGLENTFKAIKLDLKNGNVVKIRNLDFDFINCFMADFSCVVQRSSLLFNDLDLSDISTNNERINEITDEIPSLFESLFELRNKLILSEVDVTFSNLFERIKKTFIGYLNAMKIVIKCIVTDTFAEAKTLMDEAQIRLNEATDSLNIFNKICGTYQIISKTNPLESKATDYYDILLMSTFFIETEVVEDLADIIEKSEEQIYKYFSFTLLQDKATYGDNKLLLLAPFMSLSLFSFNEGQFQNKVHKVVKILTEAFNLNKEIFMDFTNHYFKKYHYALDKTLEISKRDMLFLSHSENDYDTYISGSIGTYKDLCEGVYRDLASVIVLSIKILNKSSNVDVGKIIDMGFAEKAELIRGQNKLKLDILSNGVNKIIRHAEAHVDYTIDAASKRIIFRNKKQDSEDTDLLSLSYDEFVSEKILLHETLNAILCGISIFSLNNKECFHDKFEPQTIDKLGKILNGGSVIFAKFGITQVTQNVVFDNLLNVEKLQIKAVSALHTDKSILEKCFKCCAYYAHCYNNNVQYVEFELFDCNDKLIGNLSYHHKYISNWFGNRDNRLQQYNFLIVYLTLNISYCYDGGIADSLNNNDFCGIVFVKSILSYVLPILKELISCGQVIHNECEVKTELNYIVKISNIYVSHLDNPQGVQGLKRSLLNLIYVIESFGENKVASNMKFREMALFYSRVTETIASSSVEDFFDVLNKHRLIFSVGRNDLCPCGSNKKYKFCCNI